MMDALIEAAHEIGLTWVTLHPSEMGRPLYESIGFKAWKEMGLHVPTAIQRRETDI
jgi:Fe-S cluster biosynthesis and repair protein YggX